MCFRRKNDNNSEKKENIKLLPKEYKIKTLNHPKTSEKIHPTTSKKILLIKNK